VSHVISIEFFLSFTKKYLIGVFNIRKMIFFFIDILHIEEIVFILFCFDDFDIVWIREVLS